jgi:hypothetical protein
MKSESTLFDAAALSATTLGILTLSLLLPGCAGPSETNSQPKPGSGIAEYRQIAREAHRSVAATVESLEALTRPRTDDSKPHPELARFDRALHDLELTSVKTRSRAEAIIARGEAYFDEWKENLSATTNQSAARAESQRYSRLLGHFARVRDRSGEVRTEFRPFMAKLREFRATLDQSPNTAGSESSRATMGLLTASGRRVLEALNAVTKTLDEAEVELRASLASKP